ncbi:MAG TPA: glycosyltransferase family 9 protein [Candidatus Acidoferrales bacterium]|nr:glycosyltransferase family 9 protein [Candidatus Acidoferrales bacterium]
MSGAHEAGRRPDRIAVFVENRPFFGALIVHLPLLHALRTRHPAARVALFSPFEEAAQLVDLGAADQLVRYTGRFADVRARLARFAPDAAIVLRPASRWLDLAVATSGTRERAGFDSWLAPLAYTRRVPHDTSIYRPRKYLTLIERREDALAAPLDPWFRLAAAVAPDARERGELAILPGGGAGDFKRWGAGHFLELAAQLAADDASLRFAWVLGPQEAALAARIAASPVAERSRCVVARPVAELAALAFSARGAVGNDCGPGHVFQMCGCPFACVMSDHDGEAKLRVAEWIDAPWRGLASVSAPGRPIADVAPEVVAANVRRMLATAPEPTAGPDATAPAAASFEAAPPVKTR